MSVRSSTDVESSHGLERSLNANTPFSKFYDAWEELASETGIQHTETDAEGKLRELRMGLIIVFFFFFFQNLQLVFCSFSADDEDYAGFDYSLIGQLSEVRLVYLNRFIQEIINYFMGLVPNNSVVIVKVKDQATHSEKWVKTSEIEGSPAVKLDRSPRKPIIIMPRKTDSLDYLKLDIVHITVQNTFQWFRGTKKEINAVHLDIMTIKVEDTNLNVGMGVELGESIIHDVKGVCIVIRR